MSSAVVLVMTSVALAQSEFTEDVPQLGSPVTAAAVAELDYVILPDGTGLPDGSGSVTQGAEVYAMHCLACHGDKGQGGPNDRLAGGHGSIDSARPVKTVGSYWPYATTVFDYVRRAMPYQAPGSLSADEVYALTAYLLYVNGIVGEAERLDADSLPAIKMPNRDNFVWAWEPSGDVRKRAAESRK